MLVPYSMACSVWKVPFFPVMPWQITRVLLSTKTAGEGAAVAAAAKPRVWRRREAADPSSCDARREEAAAMAGAVRRRRVLFLPFLFFSPYSIRFLSGFLGWFPSPSYVFGLPFWGLANGDISYAIVVSVQSCNPRI